uniref:hypothetical protein n=1 Tax=Chrysotila carterae TaxID=13221 RepID=UPI0022F314F8|nr:hypothetical protein PKF17_pgp024 [Chrysotila carterae]WAK83225.1 hypothetical protein [Chrysotila carterae]
MSLLNFLFKTCISGLIFNMVNFKSFLPNLKLGIRNKVKNLKNKAKNAAQNFSKKISEAKSKPRSKRKSLFLGFTTALGIFGVTLVASSLPAVAQDSQIKRPKTNNLTSSEDILNAVSSAAATVYIF